MKISKIVVDQPLWRFDWLFGYLLLEKMHPPPRPEETWGIGLAFTCLVCSCAVFGVCLYPVMKKAMFKYIITWLIGMAVSSLSAIAVFQLIPAAFNMRMGPWLIDWLVEYSFMMSVMAFEWFSCFHCSRRDAGGDFRLHSQVPRSYFCVLCLFPGGKTLQISRGTTQTKRAQNGSTS